MDLFEERAKSHKLRSELENDFVINANGAAFEEYSPMANLSGGMSTPEFVDPSNTGKSLGRAVLGGVQDAVKGIVSTSDDIGQFIDSKLGSLGYINYDENGFSFSRDKPQDMPNMDDAFSQGLRDAGIEVPQGDGIMENLGRGLVQFAVGMGVAPIKGVSLLANMGRGAFADALFDPEGGNLSTLINEAGYGNLVTEFLDSKVGEDAEADERLTGRLTAALEGLGIGIPELVVKSFRALRSDKELAAKIKSKLQAVGKRLNQPGEMPPTSSFGASEIDTSIMDKNNSVNSALDVIKDIEEDHSKVEAKAVKNIAFYANKEGGQAIGNKSVVVPIDRSIYNEYIKPLTNLSYSDHAKQYPSEKYAFLTSVADFDGNPTTGLYKLRKTGASIEDVMPTAKQYYIEVDSFDAPEAISYRSTFDSDVFNNAGQMFQGAEPVKIDADEAVNVLNLRAEQMELAPNDRVQPSGEVMFDTTPESYARTFPEQKETPVPRAPEGKALPLGDRARKVIEMSDVISDKLAERAKPFVGTNVQFFYNTGPIIDKAVELGYSKEQAFGALRKFALNYAATSPRTKTEENLRSASLAGVKQERGIDIGTIIGPGGSGINEKGYPMIINPGGLHRKLLDDVMASGISFDTNPKPATFAENVSGNLAGVTVDTHAIRAVFDVLNELEPGSIPLKFIGGKTAAKTKEFQEMYQKNPSSFDAATMVADTLQSQKINGKDMQTEYAVFSDIYKQVAEKLGVNPAEAQSLSWFANGNKTGLASEPKTIVELIDDRVDVTAQLTGMSKDEVFKKFFQGSIPLLSLGGGVTLLESGASITDEEDS